MRDPVRFKEYVGDEDIHDGEIIELSEIGENLVVEMKSGGWKRKHGELFQIVFSNVKMTQKNNPLGRCIYALCELEGHGGVRYFHFAAHDDQPCLDIHSESLSIRESH